MRRAHGSATGAAFRLSVHRACTLLHQSRFSQLSSPLPHRHLTVVPLIGYQRYYGEVTVRIGCSDGAGRLSVHNRDTLEGGDSQLSTPLMAGSSVFCASNILLSDSGPTKVPFGSEVRTPGCSDGRASVLASPNFYGNQGNQGSRGRSTSLWSGYGHLRR